MFFKIGDLENFSVLTGKYLCWSLAGQQLSCEYCNFLKNSFFRRTPPVTASEILINFPGKHQWRRRNRSGIFLISTIEYESMFISH